MTTGLHVSLGYVWDLLISCLASWSQPLGGPYMTGHLYTCIWGSTRSPLWDSKCHKSSQWIDPAVPTGDLSCAALLRLAATRLARLETEPKGSKCQCLELYAQTVSCFVTCYPTVGTQNPV